MSDSVGQQAFALHQETEMGVLDCLRAVRAYDTHAERLAYLREIYSQGLLDENGQVCRSSMMPPGLRAP